MRKPPFWATFLTFCGICVLCTLGAWQYQRMGWKHDILTKLEAAYETSQSEAIDFQSIEKDDFAYGRATGIALGDKAFLLGPTVKDKEIGKNLILPLKTNQGTVLINMGWSAAPLEQQPIQALNGKRIWVEGRARAPHWNSFTPDNDPDNGLWFKPDIEEIAALKDLKDPIPFILYAQATSHTFSNNAYPNNARWAPQNNHLQYTLFWFAMAFALAAIYGLRFLRKP